MADVDEDVIPHDGGAADEGDLTDETQDFRFLASISREDATIPRRGAKDFEPHATALQSDTLTASRQAMHNALSFQRVHQPKGYNRATYHPESNMAYIYNAKGVHFTKVGNVLSAQDDPLGDDEFRAKRLWLLPEEILYFLERGSLDVRWPAMDTDGEDEGLPMSLQGAYAMLIGDEESLTFERYSVYSSLKRMGYTVLRAPTWDSAGGPRRTECFAPLRPPPYRAWHVGLINYYTSWWSLWFPNKGPDESTIRGEGPLVPPKLYRSYADIYRRLALVPYHDPTVQYFPSDPGNVTDPAFRVTYHAWKPGSLTFKKSAPGSPDFRIAVVNARETAVPTLEQLETLMETLPYDPPMEHAPFSQKVKHGYKNVMLAIVDQGVVSYLRVSDAAFGREKLYERTGKGTGGKRGGRGGGRGRGRGRGR